MYGESSSEDINFNNNEYGRNFDTDEPDFPSQVERLFGAPRYLTVEEAKKVCEEEFKRLYQQQIQQQREKENAERNTSNRGQNLIIAAGTRKKNTPEITAARNHVQVCLSF